MNLGLVLVLLSALAAAEPPSPVTVLEARFAGHAAAPGTYDTSVKEECRRFPEGDLFPFTFPAMAFGQLALVRSDGRGELLAAMAAMVDLAIPHVARRVGAPGGRLERLPRFNRHATYLCQLDLALGLYRRAGGDDRYDALRIHLSDLVHDALVKRKGKPLDSFPEYSWPFDTVPCLVALRLDDRIRGSDRSDGAIEEHLAWIRDHGTDPDTGLPWSRVDGQATKGTELPRGCDLSLRLSLLAQVDPAGARTQYEAYRKRFWLERFLLAGFAEWPDGRERFADIDSGPILWGIGLAASGLGLATTKAFGDTLRHTRLTLQLEQVRAWIAGLKELPEGAATPTLGDMIPVSPGYLTGFLYGDAVLFWALTWTDWGID
jgi:hypothetical protein